MASSNERGLRISPGNDCSLNMSAANERVGIRPLHALFVECTVLITSGLLFLRVVIDAVSFLDVFNDRNDFVDFLECLDSIDFLECID